MPPPEPKADTPTSYYWERRAKKAERDLDAALKREGDLAATMRVIIRAPAQDADGIARKAMARHDEALS